MMLRITLTLLCWTALAKDKPDPRLSSVTAVFVAGNNQAAEKAREMLRGGKACLTLATKADDADATLEVAVESQTMGGQFGGFGGRNSVISGTLTLKSGDLIWSRSARATDAPLMSGAKSGGGMLVKYLADDASCKARTKK